MQSKGGHALSHIGLYRPSPEPLRGGQEQSSFPTVGVCEKQQFAALLSKADQHETKKPARHLTAKSPPAESGGLSVLKCILSN